MTVANNTLQNTSKIFEMTLKESMRLLHNNLAFTRNINRQYDKSFAVTGAKIGEAANARLPNQYYVSNGSNLVKQDTVQRTKAVVLDTQNHVSVGFITRDLTTKFDQYSKEVLQPAMAVLSSKIDQNGLLLAKTVYNHVGTPGSAPGSNTGSNLAVCNAPMVFLNSGMMLDNSAVPRDGLRSVVMNPIAHATSANGMSGLFNAQNIVSEQYKVGLLAKDTLGFDFHMSQNIQRVTFGTRANGTISGANQAGANLVITGAGNAATILIGDTFTVANVYSVNPETQQTTGLLQQFVVTANATMDANGANTLTISPSIVVAAANVANGTVDALPANGAALTWTGTASTTAAMNLAFHRDFATLVTADLVMPENVAGARMNYDGISMRIIKDYDITTDEEICRIDVLYGWSLLRPEMACKIWG